MSDASTLNCSETEGEFAVKLLDPFAQTLNPVGGKANI